MALYTYKEREIYKDPTEVVSLKEINTVKSCEDETHKEFTFRVDCKDRSFYLGAESTADKESWIGQIGKALVMRTIGSN
jgi:hypothetical protein